MNPGYRAIHQLPSTQRHLFATYARIFQPISHQNLVQRLRPREHDPLQPNRPHGPHDGAIRIRPARLRRGGLLPNNSRKLADEVVADRRARDIAQRREQIRPEEDLVYDFVGQESWEGRGRSGVRIGD